MTLYGILSKHKVAGKDGHEGHIPLSLNQTEHQKNTFQKQNKLFSLMVLLAEDTDFINVKPHFP